MFTLLQTHTRSKMKRMSRKKRLKIVIQLLSFNKAQSSFAAFSPSFMIDGNQYTFLSSPFYRLFTFLRSHTFE